MALTIGTSLSAFKPVQSSAPSATTQNDGATVTSSLSELFKSQNSSSNSLSLAPENQTKSIADFGLEYAMYLLINQSLVEQQQALLSATLPKTSLFHTYSLPASLNFPLRKPMFEPHLFSQNTPSFLSMTPNRDSTSPQSRNSSADEFCILQNSISKNKLGRSYNPGRPLAMADRQKILDLYERGHKISHIARIIGVTHSCVSKIMTRYRRTGSMHPRSAQQHKKQQYNNQSSSSSSSCSASSSADSTRSISPVNQPNNNNNSSILTSFDPSLLNLSFLPKSTDQVAFNSSMFLPKPIPISIQQC